MPLNTSDDSCDFVRDKYYSYLKDGYGPVKEKRRSLTAEQSLF